MPTALNRMLRRRRDRRGQRLVASSTRRQRRRLRAAAVAVRRLGRRGRVRPAGHGAAAAGRARPWPPRAESPRPWPSCGRCCPSVEVLRTRTSRRRPAADRRRGAALRLLGPDAAPRPRRRCGASAPACRWCSPSGPRAPRSRPSALAIDAALAERRRRRRRRTPPTSPATPRVRYAYPAGYLARYFEKLRYRFGAARARRASRRFFELAARDRRARRGRRSCASPTTSCACADGDRRAPHPHRRRDPRPRRCRASACRDEDAVDAAALPRPGRGRPRRRRAARAQARTRTRSRSSSTGTSTTRTSASRTATSARSTGAPGDRREGYILPKPMIFKKIEETLRDRRHRRR